MTTFEETDKKVLVTVVENFVCDAVKEENGEDQVKKGVEKGNQFKMCLVDQLLVARAT